MGDSALQQGITFPVDDVPVNEATLDLESAKIREHFLFGMRPVERFSHSDKALVFAFDIVMAHRFVGAVHKAFSEHRPLAISPDHIWLMICQGFARHVKLNAESLRHLFVEHEGTSRLTVIRLFKRHAPEDDWQNVLAEFRDHLRERVIGDIVDVLTADFSTTTDVERTAFVIAVMDAFQEYFSYGVTLCGIPSITLEGSPSDWRSLLERTRRLCAYDLDWWFDQLEPILKELINASEGNVNRAFWQGLYKHRDRSGGPVIHGWITRFFPYIEITKRVSGKEVKFEKYWVRNPYWTAEYDDSYAEPSVFPQGFCTADAGTGMSAAPFTWEALDGTFNMIFAAGFVGVSQNPTTHALRPEIGWAVMDDNLTPS